MQMIQRIIWVCFIFSVCELVYSWLCQRLVNAIFVMHWPKWMSISVEFVWKCCCCYYYYYLKSFCRIWNCVIKRYIFGWLSPFRRFSFFKLIFRCCLCFARSGHFISKHKVFHWTRPCACIFSFANRPHFQFTHFHSQTKSPKYFVVFFSTMIDHKSLI